MAISVRQSRGDSAYYFYVQLLCSSSFGQLISDSFYNSKFQMRSVASKYDLLSTKFPVAKCYSCDVHYMKEKLQTDIQSGKVVISRMMDVPARRSRLLCSLLHKQCRSPANSFDVARTNRPVTSVVNDKYPFSIYLRNVAKFSAPVRGDEYIRACTPVVKENASVSRSVDGMIQLKEQSIVADCSISSLYDATVPVPFLILQEPMDIDAGMCLTSQLQVVAISRHLGFEGGAKKRDITYAGAVEAVGPDICAQLAKKNKRHYNPVASSVQSNSQSTKQQPASQNSPVQSQSKSSLPSAEQLQSLPAEQKCQQKQSITPADECASSRAQFRQVPVPANSS
uniref:Uncharacterized protein n=1 Tax=Ditylenchus dipsaci TaxID=166011 RepID=A0A915CSG6_9BILA